jgi:hypothetical protein
MRHNHTSDAMNSESLTPAPALAPGRSPSISAVSTAGDSCTKRISGTEA